LVLGLCLYSLSAFGQAVTLIELEGVAVEAKVTMDQKIRRDGREFPVQLHQEQKISFFPDNKIEWTSTPTSHTPRGIRQGPTRTGRMTLGQPGETKQLGGGDYIWIFEDGTLTTLRTYAKQGGYKRTIAFAHEGGKITCTAKETFVREEGVGRIVLRSAIDDVPVEVLSAKQVASTCRVIKR
jgi:hypothetical protein